MRTLANFALFQIGWFACVLESVGGLSAVATTAMVIALHFVFVSQNRGREAGLMVAVVGGGSLVTALNVAVGAVSFDGAPVAWLGVPVFILLLWALFSTLLCHSLAWLHGRPLLAAICGLVGSPLSYRGAEALGTVRVNADFLNGSLVLGLTWGVAVPLLLALATRVVPQSDTEAAALP